MLMVPFNMFNIMVKAGSQLSLIKSYGILYLEDINNIAYACRFDKSTIIQELIAFAENFSYLSNMIEEFCKAYPKEINRYSDSGWLPLAKVIELTIPTSYKLELIKILLQYGADVNKDIYYTDNVGRWTTFLGLSNGWHNPKTRCYTPPCPEIKKLLLEYDATTSNHYNDYDNVRILSSKIALLNEKN